MDLLAILRSLRRHAWVTVSVAGLVVAGLVYVTFFVAPTYEATSSYVLFSPPGAPTPDDIARDPLLALVHSDNPYGRMEPAVVVDLVAQRVNQGQVRRQLIALGADDRYDVTNGGLYGVAGPTAEIKGVGDSPRAALRTTKLVGAAYVRELQALQAVQGTDDAYMVKAVQVDAADHATEKTSSRLRALLGVTALGLVVLFVAISVAEAIDSAKREQAARRSQFMVPRGFERNGAMNERSGARPSVREPATNGANGSADDDRRSGWLPHG
jgi:hypothetical protein